MLSSLYIHFLWQGIYTVVLSLHEKALRVYSYLFGIFILAILKNFK